MMKWLYEQALQRGDAPFINDMTYEEMLKAVEHKAGQLFPYVKDENRVALHGHNSVELALHIFALWRLGKEIVFLNVHNTAEEIHHQLHTLHTKVLFTEGLQNLCSPSILAYTFSSVNESPASSLDPWSYGDTDIACILNTSATTGRFKSVPIRWKQIEAHVKASAEVLGVERDDNWLIVLPIFHVSGLSILLRTLYNGTRATIMEHYEKNDLLHRLHAGEVTMVSLVPTVLKEILSELTHHRLRVLLLGGEFIPHQVVTESLEKKIPLYKTYGMTETFSQSATVNVLAHPEKIHSVGKALPGVQIHIVDPDEDGIGEIHIQSPMLMDGYLGMDPLEGTLNSMDLGYVDEDGYLYVLNRRQDLIISGGENIYPKELEDTMYLIPGVKECAVIGVSHEKWGQVPVAYVVGSVTATELKATLEEKHSKYKVPKDFVFLEALPKNGSQKILRGELVKHYESYRAVTD